MIRKTAARATAGFPWADERPSADDSECLNGGAEEIALSVFGQAQTADYSRDG